MLHHHQKAFMPHNVPSMLCTFCCICCFCCYYCCLISFMAFCIVSVRHVARSQTPTNQQTKRLWLWHAGGLVGHWLDASRRLLLVVHNSRFYCRCLRLLRVICTGVSVCVWVCVGCVARLLCGCWVFWCFGGPCVPYRVSRHANVSRLGTVCLSELCCLVGYVGSRWLLLAAGCWQLPTVINALLVHNLAGALQLFRCFCYVNNFVCHFPCLLLLFFLPLLLLLCRQNHF